MDDELLVLGITVLAKIHAEELDFSCSDCSESKQNALYCSGISNYPVVIDEELGEFYSCPLRFLSEEVYNWYDEYSYYQVFEGTAPRYGEHNNRFWGLTKIYKNEYDKACERKRDKPKNTDRETTNSLAKLRQGFKGKNNG